MIISIDTDSLHHTSFIQYVCQFITMHPLSPEVLNLGLNLGKADLHINYGVPSKTGLTIPKQNLVFDAEGSTNGGFTANRYTGKNYSIYSVEGNTKTDTAFFSDDQFGFDLLEMIFFHISRFEEYYCPQSLKDEWDMMHESHHFLVKHHIHHIPVVDHLVVEFLISLGLTPRFEQTRFSLTHDVDVLRKFKNPKRVIRSLGRSFLDSGLAGFIKTAKLIWQVITKQLSDPYNSFSDLLVDSSTNQFEYQVLFIMNGGTSRYDNYYQINDNYLSSVIDSAIQLGYSIGLHASYNTDQNGDQFQKEHLGLTEHLGDVVNYNRQHFLHFDFSKTATFIEKSGILFDSTIGYQRLIGFRSGTGFPYHLYDFSSDFAFRFKELPMVVMDGALLAEAKDDIPIAQQRLTTFIEQHSRHTHITFNVHNTIFDPTKRDVVEMHKLYRQILRYGVKNL